MSTLRNSALGVALTSAAVATVIGAATADAAAKYYGTLSISRSTGKVVAATDHPSWVAADAAAIRECAVYDCQITVRFADECAAIAQGADGQYGWATGPSRQEAEKAAVDGLGQSTAPFPDLGSASPRAADIRISSCTKNAI